MTVCSVVILKDAIVAIADGRLMTGDRRSFDTTEKIIRFQPRYRLPIIAVNRFSHFEEKAGKSWCVMYAGTYALCREVIETFRNRISSLYLPRDYDQGGAPYLTRDFDPGRNYLNDYNFRPDEILAFHRSLIVGEFMDCLQEKADEWVGHGKHLDCEFISRSMMNGESGPRAGAELL